MADTINTYGSLTNEQKTFYERTLLKRLLPNLLFMKYGQKRNIPKNEGDKINFRRFNSLAAATTALTEGTTPTGATLDITKVEAQVQQYGNFVKITDKLDMVGIDPVLTETSQLLGENAAETMDLIVRDEVSAGTTVLYAGTAGTRDGITASDVMTSTLIRKAVRTLRKNNAKPVDGKYFIGIVDPEVAYDLMNDSLWQDVSKYNGGEAIKSGEIGRLGGVRFFETTQVKVDNNTSSVPIHLCMIIGKDAYGVVDVEGSAKPEMIVKQLGSAGTDDPLNQRASAGWKSMFCAKRLQELAMARIEVAASK